LLMQQLALCKTNTDLEALTPLKKCPVVAP